MDFGMLREELVRKLVREGILRTQALINAFRKVPRELFIPPELQDMAYVDSPLPIGYGQTISAPHMVALMLEELSPRLGDRVLEVGTGSGYEAALLAEVVGNKGHVWTIEIIPELAQVASKKLRSLGYADRITVVVGDGSKGFREGAPYDKVIVSAACPEVPPPLTEQLAVKGRLVIPVGSEHMQVLKIIEKVDEGRYKVKDSVPCVFVPLRGEYGF